MATLILSGSVSHGTLRTADLVPTFANLLSDIDEHIVDIGDDNRDLIASARAITDFDCEESQWILHDLMDALDTHAPEGMYFGAHSGDGSDFGFWDME